MSLFPCPCFGVGRGGGGFPPFVALGLAVGWGGRRRSPWLPVWCPGHQEPRDKFDEFRPPAPPPPPRIQFYPESPMDIGGRGPPTLSPLHQTLFGGWGPWTPFSTVFSTPVFVQPTGRLVEVLPHDSRTSPCLETLVCCTHSAHSLIEGTNLPICSLYPPSYSSL